jgi:uncharacterized membrane protein
VNAPSLSPRQRIALASLAAITLMVVVGLIAHTAVEQARIRALADTARLSREVDRLSAEVGRLESENQQVRQRLEEEREHPEVRVASQAAWLAELRANGLTDPPAELVQDLRSHPELIQLKAVLGGTMRFIGPFTVTDRWVIAAYEDGHISGCGIFAYEVSDGRINWHLVDQTRWSP